MRPSAFRSLAGALFFLIGTSSILLAATDPPGSTTQRVEKRRGRGADAAARKATPEARAARKEARASATADGPGANPEASRGDSPRRAGRSRPAGEPGRAKARRTSPLLAESLTSGAPAGWTYSPEGEGSGLCTLVCPADSTVGTDPGVCSATITLPPPYPVGSCGTVLCQELVANQRGGLVLSPKYLGGGDCCTANGTPGCTDTTCEASVCLQDPFCCDVSWDSICAAEAATTCSICGGGSTLPLGTTTVVCEEVLNGRGDGGLPAVSSCCEPTGAQGCDDATCQNSVCAVDPFCCDTSWDSICVTEAQTLCSPLCGVSNSCTYDVTVQDFEPPALTLPADITVGTDAPACSAAVGFSPGASDNCPGVGTPVCNPASGSTFALGTTGVACSVADAASNTANGGFNVTVVDDDPPAILCPADVFAMAPPGALSWPVSYPAPTPSDNCPGVGASCAPPSGDPFPIGTTTTACVATDGAGLTATCDFDVTVTAATIQEIPTASELGLLALAAMLAGAALLVLRRPR